MLKLKTFALTLFNSFSNIIMQDEKWEKLICLRLNKILQNYRVNGKVR